MNPELKKILDEKFPPIKHKRLYWGVWSLIIAVWIIGGLYLHAVVKADEQVLLEQQQVQLQKEDRLRRAAAYDRARAEQRLSTKSVKNAVDVLNKR